MADYSDTESSTLMTNGKSRKQPDWERFGLSDEQQKESAAAPVQHETDEVFEHHTGAEKNELFSEDQVREGTGKAKVNHVTRACLSACSNCTPFF